MNQPWHLRQRVRQIRGLLKQALPYRLRPYLVAHPFFEERLCRGPQVEIRIKLASQAFNVKKGLLQQRQLRLNFHVKPA